jgi:hypothetical protein
MRSLRRNLRNRHAAQTVLGRARASTPRRWTGQSFGSNKRACGSPVRKRQIKGRTRDRSKPRINANSWVSVPANANSSIKKHTRTGAGAIGVGGRLKSEQGRVCRGASTWVAFMIAFIPLLRTGNGGAVRLRLCYGLVLLLKAIECRR